MARYSDILVNQYEAPIAGATVTVTVPITNALAALTDDNGNALNQPLVTALDGSYSFNATDALYDIAFGYAGRNIGNNLNVIVGNASTLPTGSVFNGLGTSPVIAPSQAAVAGGLNGRVPLINLAAQAASQSVAIGNDSVNTSGNNQAGKGDWRYNASPSVISAGYTSFVTSNGRGFKISRFAPPSAVVTGAIGISDITAANLVDESAYLQGLSTAMQADCATLPGKSGGGIQRLDPTLPIYINQPVTLKWVRLVGEFRRGEILGHDANGNNPDKSSISLGSQASTIVCGPNGKITLGDGAYLENVCIVSLDAARFISPAGGSTEAQVNALLAAYANYPVAIDTMNGASDCGVINSMIAGFSLGAKFVYNERYRFEGNKVDCINGFYQSQTYDYSWCLNNEFYPFVWSHRFASGGQECLKAYGTAIKYDTGLDTTRSVDGGWCCNNGTYGYLIGYDFTSPNGLLVQGNWADNDQSRSDTGNTIAYRTSGNARRAKFLANHADSHGRGFDIQGSGTMPDMNTTAGCTVSHMRYGLAADIVGGLHFFQGPSPLYIEVTEGCGKVTWSQTSISDWNGPLIGLLGGGLPSAATRSLIDLGKVTTTRNGVGASYDLRQWRSFVETGNPSGTISPLSQNNDYQKVSTLTLSNGSSPIDGYGEFRNGSFYAAYDGIYLFTFTMEGNAQASDISNVGGNALTQAQLRLNGVAQPSSQDIKYLSVGGDHTWRCTARIFVQHSQTVDPWFYTTVPIKIATNQAIFTVIRVE